MRKVLAFVLAALFSTVQLLAQPRTVSGKVTDEQGSPLPNVSIQVKGTSFGTTTRSDGTYSLAVSPSARALLFSSVNMAQVEVTIGGKSEINVTLKPANSNLQEVVVVGYGAVQKKSDVTASLATVKAAPIATLVTPSIDKQLGGRASGVQVTNPSGLVNQAPRIRIRGANSVSGSRSPLFVLDGTAIASGGFSGVTNDNLLADINPADIESVEVLKDGAAAALYGSQAVNGVIVITTKKGRSGAARVNYSGTFGFSKPYKKLDLLSGNEFVTIANEKLAAAGQAAQAFNPKNINTDWQSVIFRSTARSQIHNFSIESGTDKTKLYLSFNYSDQQGLVITNRARRYGVRANVDQKVGSWLNISNNITLSRSEDFDQNNGGNSLSGAVYNASRALPNVSPYDSSNLKFSGYNVTPDGKALGQGDNTRLIDNNNTNIAYVLAKNKFESVKHRIIDNITVDIKPTSWLTFTSKTNLDYINLNDFQSWDPLHGDGQGANGIVYNQAVNSLAWVLQNYINVMRGWGDHSIGATIGTELTDGKTNSFYAQGSGVADPFLQQQNVISNSFTTPQSGGSYSEGPSRVSYFGRVFYDYKSKYYVEGIFRRDGLSKFAKDSRWGNFPGASVGYRISKEEFWSPLSRIVNDFKIRASWGKVGNPNIASGDFGFLNLYGLAPYGAISGISAAQIGNNKLRWETNEKFDAGVDMSFLDSRVNLVLDYFLNKNNNLVLRALLPASLGVPGNATFRNLGTMKNQGFEIAVNASVLRGKDLRWDIGFNYTHQDNKVLELYQHKDQNVAAGAGSTYALIREGEPINVLYGYRFAGVNSANGNPMYYKADGTKIQGNVTDTKYYTVNADGSLGTQTTLAGTDQAILGNTLVKWFGGITSTLSYKNFGLDMLWRYAGGNKILDITRQESMLNQGFTNSGREILQRWTTKGQVTDVPRIWYGRDNFINLTGNSVSRFVEPGDFIRLDNLQISYTLDHDLLRRMSGEAIKSFKFFVQGQNLLVITKYKGLDPDNIVEQGVDYNTVPSARTFSVGVNVGF